MKLFTLLFLLSISVMGNNFKTLNGNLTKLKESNKYLVIQTELSLNELKDNFNNIDEVKKINSNVFVIKFSELPTTIPTTFKIIKSYNIQKEWPLIPSNRIIVKTKESTSKTKFYQILRDNNLKVAENILPNVYVVNVDIDNNLEIANKLYDTSLFEYSYPDFYIYHIKKFVPNDTYYSNYQWHLNSSSIGVNAESAWNINRGSSDIKIAIVDDGMTIYHEDLNIINYRDFTTNDNDFDDGGDHGTSCAGVAAAKGNNSKGVTGLCMNCSIIAAKMMHSTGYSLSSADVKAIKWSVDQGADILNNSWGYETDFNIRNSNPGLVDAINYATTYGRDGKGCVVLFASGNEDRRFSNESLEGLENTITVGASDDSNDRSYYSNYGNRLDVVAPSNGGRRGIATTDAYSRSGDDQRGYNVGAYTATFGGTSSATPLVSGLVGLILSENSNLTYTEVKEVLINSTQKIGSGYDSNGHSDYYGYGKIDAKKALDYVLAMNNSNPCDSVNCQTNESCVTENNRGVCVCNSGFNLVNGNCVAEAADLCENVNCPQNSHCTANETETFCYCNDGFDVNEDATACVEVYVDPCEVTNCPNNSTCESNNDEAVCKCNTGYEMNNSNSCVAIIVDPCETTNCPQNSTCSSDNDKVSCYCDEGFKVDSNKTGCTPSDTVCNNVNCPENSYCTEYNERAACFCNKGYIVNDNATACVEDDNLCDGINCGNGNCNSYNGEAFCECNEGYHPDGNLKCAINNINNLCIGVSCSNNGNCSVRDNAPSCNCNEGYQNQGLSCFNANVIDNDVSSEDILACDYSTTKNYSSVWFIAIFLIIVLRRRKLFKS